MEDSILFSIRTVIWDFNGTILDDVACCHKILNHLLEERNCPLVSMERYREIFCFPIQEYYRKAGLTFEKESFESMAHEFMALYRKDSAKCTLYPGVRETIQQLKEKGIRSVLISATLESALLQQMEQFACGNLFDEVVGISDIYAASKIDVAQAWAQKEKLEPSSTLWVGDSVHDQECAASIDVPFIAFLGGHQNRDTLSSLGVPMIESIPELLNYIH